MALAHSFYAEQAAVRGDLDEARRRRLDVLDFYGESPDDPFAVAARAYSQAKLAILDGDLDAAERHYRAATEGFARLDRPVMNSMCLGMVADFDERAGDYPAAITTLEAAIATNDVAARRLHRFAAGPPRLGAAPRRPAGARRGGLPAGARLGPPACDTPGDLPAPRPGWPSLHRLHGRDDAAAAAATEALELYRAGGFRRFRNRIDPTADLQAAAAVCCAVLAAIAAERDEPERAATPARAGRAPARRVGRRGAGVPARRRRPGSRDRRSRRWARTPSWPPSSGAGTATRASTAVAEPATFSAERGARSARSWMVRSSPHAAGPDSRRIP